MEHLPTQPLMNNCRLKITCLSPIYPVNDVISLFQLVRISWDVGPTGKRPQGKYVDLKSVIITIIRGNNSNNNNNTNNNSSNNTNNTKNNNNHNPLKVVCQQILVWRTNAGNIPRQETNLRTKKNASGRRPRQTTNVGEIKNETLSATRQILRKMWSTLLKMNWADNAIGKLSAVQTTKIQKTIYSVSNSETLLRCKKADEGWFTSLGLLL